MEDKVKQVISQVDSGNYDYINTLDGKRVAINKNTGEALGTILIEAPLGSSVTTPVGQQERKLYFETHNADGTQKRRSGGRFYFWKFLSDDLQKIDLPPADITRLVFLNTYLGYDGYLMRNERTPMKKSDLPKLLNVSRSTAKYFWRSVSRYYITEKDGKLYPNADVIKRGQLRNDREWVKYKWMYFNGIRTLYNSVPISQHKILGYLFLLLPYINVQYNFLCWNPLEREFEYIKPMTLREFCDAIGIDYTQRNRLLAVYDKIVFDVNGSRQKFCNFIGNPIRKDEMQIFVNPNILYNGMQKEKVEILGKFCVC